MEKTINVQEVLAAAKTVEELRAIAKEHGISSNNATYRQILKSLKEGAGVEMAKKHKLGKGFEVASKQAYYEDRKFDQSSYAKYTKNTAYKAALDRYEDFRERFLLSRSEFPVVVLGIQWFNKVDQYDRVGTITFQVPPNYMEVKDWDNVDQEFKWYPMEQFNYNAMNPARSRRRPRLTPGSGIITLALKESEERGVSVSLPKSKGKNDVYYDVFRTRQIGFDGKPLEFFHTDNNQSLVAALTAFVQTMIGEFVQANPQNRNGFNEHCGNCRHMVYLPIRDERDDESIGMSGNTIEELAQFGQFVPQWICGVYRDFVDLHAVEEMNAALVEQDQVYYVEKQGRLEERKAQQGEVVIGGKMYKTYNVRKEATQERCMECPFYHKNERKSPTSKEWYTERAEAGRQVIQTLTKANGRETWVTKFPGEVAEPIEFRVLGLGGVNVYGTPEVMSVASADFIPTIEDFNKQEAEVAKKISLIHTACYKFDEVTEEALNALLVIIQNKPEGLSPTMARRWDRAVQRLVETIQENQE